jgi:adenosine kinase
VGAVGADFAEYRAWLESHNVDTSAVRVSTTAHTARFMCTTDADQSQIATFYTGAMAEARHIGLMELCTDEDLVVIAPNDPAAMLRHTRECRALDIAFAADPSQQLARMDRDDVRTLVEGAEWLFTNAYEHDLLLSTTGWSHDDVLSRVGSWVTTLGGDGVRVVSRSGGALEVPAVPVTRVSDPTGAGDGFRAGFIAGVCCGLSLTRSAQLGCALASFVLAGLGPQDYEMGLGELLTRVGEAYGSDAEVDLASRIRSTGPEGWCG